MAAAMNGMALHGGIIPYSGTFLVFSDYCRPAIRLAALMGQRVIHVMTHDSIGLGEDGPTHQPVEHLAALRAIPNLKVFRPCDAVETVECWQLALETTGGPSVLALTRQNVPQLRQGFDEANRCARGAYELIAAPLSFPRAGERRPSRVAVCLGLGSRDRGRGALSFWPRTASPARVVSVPCFELFLAAPDAERAAIIGEAPGERRGRSRHSPGLGCDHRLGWNVRGLDRFWRQRALQGALSPLWHYAREGGRGRAGKLKAATTQMVPPARARTLTLPPAARALSRGGRQSRSVVLISTGEHRGLRRFSSLRMRDRVGGLWASRQAPSSSASTERQSDGEGELRRGRGCDSYRTAVKGRRIARDVAGGAHVGSRSHQRLRPHRPQYPARRGRGWPQRISRSSPSTISPRSRPTRICCATTPCMAASPAR